MAAQVEQLAPSFQQCLSELAEVAKTVVATAAVDVDRDARFPHEAFAEFKRMQLLSAYVPAEYGGLGFSMAQLCEMCELLGRHCASTAMVFAMHQIQVACIVHHADQDPHWQAFLRELVNDQLLIASATTEIGTGGDLTSSVCALKTSSTHFDLNKMAPVISYGAEADVILVTARRHVEAASQDQVHVMVRNDKTELKQIAGWDTLGFRGTCSSGYELLANGRVEDILPETFAEILSATMHPVSHIVWGSLWLGLADSSLSVARKTVRDALRKTPSEPGVMGIRLNEADEQLCMMRGLLRSSIDAYQDIIDRRAWEETRRFAFATQTNNVKLKCSELLLDIVTRALSIVGISGYKNDSSSSLTRQLRDASGAMLMVNNDRIRAHNAPMQIAQR